MDKKHNLKRVKGPIVQVLGSKTKWSRKRLKTPVSNSNRQFQCDPVRETTELFCDLRKTNRFKDRYDPSSKLRNLGSIL